MKTIAVIEDDVLLNEALSRMLAGAGYQILRAHTFREGLDLIPQLPDLMIIDINLPDGEGTEACRQAREYSQIPVLILTARDEERDMIKAFDLGADDYLAKPFGVMELISRVKALLRRSNAASEEKTLMLGEIQIDNEKHCVYVGNRLCELTYKEFELLKMMMQNVGIVLTRDRIMDRVWGTDYEGESRTLDMHIKTLRKKLGEEGTRIKTVRNVGYVLE